MQRKSAISPLLLASLLLGGTFLYSCNHEPASIRIPHHTTPNNHPAHILLKTKHKRTYVSRRIKKYYKRGNRNQYSWRAPDAKVFFDVTPQYTSSNTEAQRAIQQALKILSTNTPDALNRGIKKLQATVKQHGSSIAMYQLGAICEYQKDMLQAVKWYVLSFQNEWFKNLSDLDQFPAYIALQRIAQEDQDIRRLLLLYPLDMEPATLVEKEECYSGLIKFYQHGTAEPYLTQKENQLKINRLAKEVQLILDKIRVEEQKLKNIHEEIRQITAQPIKITQKILDKENAIAQQRSRLANSKVVTEKSVVDIQKIEILNQEKELLELEVRMKDELGKVLQEAEKEISKEVTANKNSVKQYEQLIEGIKYLKYQAYAEALACLLKAGFLPDALYHLGWIYSHVNKYLDYKKAAACFTKAITPSAFYELGLLYQQGLVPEVDKTVAYQLSIDYLTLSGTPEALCKLGVILYGQEDYLQAQAYFERAGTSEAYLYLGYLYEKGYIGANVPQPDYQQAIIHYKQVTGEEKDNKLMQKILELEILQIDTAIKEYSALETGYNDYTSIPSIPAQQSVEEYDPATNLAKLSSRNLAKERIQSLQERKKQQALLRAKRRKLNIAHISHAAPRPTIQFAFLTDKEKEAFEIFLQDPQHKKVKEIMEDIQQAQWAAVGIGKPEVLSYLFRGYEGCISRRVNGEVRFVYKVIHHEGGIHILILGWEGHYDKQ